MSHYRDFIINAETDEERRRRRREEAERLQKARGLTKSGQPASGLVDTDSTTYTGHGPRGTSFDGQGLED